jgi:FkbM family methyltransferase
MNSVVLPDDHALAIKTLLSKIPTPASIDEEASVLHVGAHTGEEVPFYFEKGYGRIYLIEANPDVAASLADRFAADPRVKVFNLAIADRCDTIPFIIHTTPRGGVESGSILKLKKLGEIVPVFDSSRSIQVQGARLDDFIETERLEGKIDLLTLDVQGAELMALAGARRALRTIKALICEVNLIETYENCALEKQVDHFMAQSGFTKEFGIYHELYQGAHRFLAWGECVWLRT